jgi:hypothetical protein
MTSTHQPAGNPRFANLERRLTEAFDSMWQSFVDPTDALYDGDGSRWQCLTAGGNTAPCFDPCQLADIRSQCRALAVENEFAINGHDYHLIKAVSPT